MTSPSVNATPFVPVIAEDPHRARGGRGNARGGRGGHSARGRNGYPYQSQHQQQVFGYGAFQHGGGAPSGYAFAPDYGFGGYAPHAAHGQFPQAFLGTVPQQESEVDEKSTEFCKALAKVAKPRPPWSIGADPTNDIAVEMSRIEAFFAQSAKDKQDTGDVWEALRATLTMLDASPQLQYTGCNSWSFFPYRGRFSVAAPGVRNATSSQLSSALFKNGCRLEREFVDARGFPCYLVEHAATKREVVLRIGEAGAAAAETVRAVLRHQMPGDVRSALNCLIVLLRQSRIIDDLEPAALTDEAAAVMVMAIANSYGERPTAERLLIDFFLTYGFKAHFDSDALSVSIDGMVNPVAKAHPDDAVSILDPANATRNLAVGMTAKKLQFLQSTFNYCYHVVSEFAKETDPHKQRGQSPLSTVLGGEPFWPRVVELAQLNVEPYVSFLHANRGRATDEMYRQRARKTNGGGPTRGGTRRN